MEKEKIYVVEGWDGDTEFFHSKDKAKEEFEKRLQGFECERITTKEDEEEGFDCYRHWDNTLNSWYFLTFAEVEYSD